MIGKITFNLILLLGCLSSYAQILTGQVLDQKSKKPLSFVNIGILNQGIGTLSDEDGNFTISLSDIYNNDSFNIALLGYKPLAFKVSDIKNRFAGTKATFYLEESSIALSEVTIRPKKFKTKIIGNRDKGSPCVSFLGDTAKDFTGCEIGTRIKLKKKSAFIDQVNFNICANEYDSITLRLNIYSKDNINILKRPIYVKVKKGQRDITIDTKPYNIKVTGDFIIAIEALNVIERKGVKGKKFSFSGGVGGSDLVARMNIYDKWEKIKVLTIGINAKVSYEE